MKLPQLSLGLSLGVEAAKAVDSEFFSIGQAQGYLYKSGSHMPVHALSGRLQAGPNDSIELTVPASLIKGVFDALHEPGAEFVVRNNRTESAVKVMTKDEVKKIGGIDKVTERGHSYNYTLGPIVELPANGDYDKLWAISIDSKDLGEIRNSYGLETSPQLGFYIPVGIKKKKVTEENKVSKLAADNKGSTSLPSPAVNLPSNAGAFRFASYPKPNQNSPTTPLKPAPVTPSVHSKAVSQEAAKLKAQRDLQKAIDGYTSGTKGPNTGAVGMSDSKQRMANIKDFREGYRSQLDAPRYKDQAKQRAMEEDQTSDIKALITTGDLLTGKPIRMGIKGLFPFLKNMGSAPAIVAGATRKAAAADRI